jgi:phosphate transport system substrate-binding protein
MKAHVFRRLLCLLWVGLLAFAARADTLIPRDAPYVLADGSVYVVGDKTLEPVLTRLNALFTRAHPEIRFTMLLRDPPVGIDGIIARVSLFAPVAHDAWESEIDPFKRLNGFHPLDIRIGRLGHAGPGRENPPAIYVNAANPLRSLTIDEVGRIFTTGRLPSDLRHWRQLGVGGEWRKHSIHAYGTRDDGMTVTALRIARFGGRPFARHYEALENDADVLEAVASDRYGIGLAGSIDSRSVPHDVRLVPLAIDAGTPPSTGDYESVRAGRYPLSPFLHIYVGAASGRNVDPVVKEYLRLALSRQGQQVLEQLSGGREGFVPLTAQESALELAKIE